MLRIVRKHRADIQLPSNARRNAMKAATILVTALFAATAIVSSGASAADADKAPAGEVPAAKVKPHSHMQEKTGVAPAAKENKEAASADEKSVAAAKKASKKRHLHPRDGK